MFGFVLFFLLVTVAAVSFFFNRESWGFPKADILFMWFPDVDLGKPLKPAKEFQTYSEFMSVDAGSLLRGLQVDPTSV